MDMIDTLLKDADFAEPVWVEGRASVADLFRPEARCGIYVLHCRNDEWYVGQSVDVVRRYAEHRLTHNDIVRLSFATTPKDMLNARERALILKFEQNGLPLRNIRDTAQLPLNARDFDLIMTVEQQNRWLTDLTYVDMEGERPVNPDLRRKYRPAFERLLKKPRANEVIAVLRAYVQATIPAVRRAELSFWMCSCPKNARLYSRINVGQQTTFEVHLIDDQPLYMWYVPRRLVRSTKAGIKRIFSELRNPMRWLNVETGRAKLKAGGQDQLYVATSSSIRAQQLINYASFKSAMRSFNLNLMLKQPSMWSAYHCLDLADRLID